MEEWWKVTDKGKRNYSEKNPTAAPLYLPQIKQGGARNVIPLIVHMTHFYYYKSICIWYRINPQRLENCS